MRPKTTYFILLAVIGLCWSASLPAQSASLAKTNLAALPSSRQKVAHRPAHRSASNAQYVLMQGQVLGRDRQPVEAFHMDVYELRADGKRVLVRTGPHPTSDYQLHLESGASYELIVQANGYDTKRYYVDASEEDVQPVPLNLKPRPANALRELPNVGFEVLPSATPLSLPELQPMPDLPAVSAAAVNVTAYPVPPAYAPRLGSTFTKSPLLRSLNPDDEPLLQLPANAQVDILEYTTAEWWMVEYRGELGWVRASAIR